MKAKALTVGIFKWRAGDCSNDGLSSRFNEILVLCPDGPEIVDLDNPPENLCVVVKRILWREKYYYVTPYALKDKQTMFGGCLCDISDSR